MGTAALELAGATGCKNCVLWAKSDDEIRHIQSQDPSQAVGFVVMNETSLDRLEGRDRLDRLAGAANVAMHHETASASTLEEVRASGRRVFGWTANTPSMMRKLLDEAPVESSPITRDLCCVLSTRVCGPVLQNVKTRSGGLCGDALHIKFKLHIYFITIIIYTHIPKFQELPRCS